MYLFTKFINELSLIPCGANTVHHIHLHLCHSPSCHFELRNSFLFQEFLRHPWNCNKEVFITFFFFTCYIKAFRVVGEGWIWWQILLLVNIWFYKCVCMKVSAILLLRFLFSFVKLWFHKTVWSILNSFERNSTIKFRNKHNFVAKKFV